MNARPVALITGARRGIGRAVALELARQGYDVALTDVISDADSSAIVADCADSGARASFFEHDSANIEAHAALIEHIYREFGQLDAVINNAGIGAPMRGDLLDLSPDNFDKVMDVNLRGAVFLCLATAKRMVAANSSRPRSFVLITSVSAALVSPERTDYCISKAGLSMFAKALALRLGPENIAVFELRPGIIKTDMTAGVREKYDCAIAGGLVPMQRWGTPEDVAKTVASLVSGGFHFATGTIIQADGGLSLHRL